VVRTGGRADGYDGAPTVRRCRGLAGRADPSRAATHAPGSAEGWDRRHPAPAIALAPAGLSGTADGAIGGSAPGRRRCDNGCLAAGRRTVRRVPAAPDDTGPVAGGTGVAPGTA